MKIFLDTANTNQIKELSKNKLINGITTNPSLMAKEQISGTSNCHKHYLKICKMIDGPVSAEVLSIDANEMLKEAINLSKIHPNIVVKIPMTKAGIKTIHKLHLKGIKTNCTLIFSSTQALLAAKVGATYVSPFIGRLDDIGENGLELIKSIRNIFNNYGFATQILAASIRSDKHIIQCAELGADVATIPYSLFESIYNHPLTSKGLNQFLLDSQTLKK